MREGYKMTSLGEIPKNWDDVKLQSVTKKIGDGIHSTPNYIQHSKFHFINGNNLINGKIVITEKTKCISKDEFDKYGLSLKNETILMSINGTIGNIAFYRGEKVILGKSAAYFQCNQKLNHKFLYYLLQSDGVKKFYENELTGSTIRNLSLKSLRITPIPLPPLPEQKKIANILSTVDEKIEAISERIIQTQELKKGLMQRLLTKGIGHTRFKDSPLGEIPESWEVICQSEVAIFYNGRAYKLSEWENSGTPVIRLQNLTGNGKEFYYSTLKLPPQQYCQKGDLLYMWSATFGSVWWKGSKAIYHYHIWKVEQDESKLNKTFHYYLLDDVTLRMKNESHGSTMLHVTKSGMENLKIQLPTLSEQQKIAAILSTVDEKLDVLQNKKLEYQELKKGLMQQLLTGKTRVKVS